MLFEDSNEDELKAQLNEDLSGRTRKGTHTERDNENTKGDTTNPFTKK
jgi:hypothetical protein